MPLHIKADSKSMANRAIVSGNIEIIKQLSELLHGKLVNENRGFLIYTGSYMGVPVSAVYHGVGGSSQSIVLEELAQLGTKRIIELNYAIKNYAGNCPAVISNSASYTNGGVIGEYVLPQKFVMSLVPSFELIVKLDDALTRHKIEHKIGPTLTVESLKAEKNSEIKFLCTEMDCGVLYALSQIRGFESACVLLSDINLPKKIIVDLENSILDAIIVD